MQIALKIVLTLVVLVLALLPTFSILILVFTEENFRFELTMLIPFGITVLGLGSFIFHIKTLRFYQQNNELVIYKNPNKIFWGLNLGYAAALVLLAIWVVYIIVRTYSVAFSTTDSELT